MTLDPAHLAHARKVADAVLYEGYLLYPYRQSSQKNQARFQFGVLMPPAYCAADESERHASQTECLAECGDGAQVEIEVRFLHLRRRTLLAAAEGSGLRETGRLRVDGDEYTSWDEACERQERFSVTVPDLSGPGVRLPLRAAAAEESEDVTDARGERAGRLVWRRAPVEGAVTVQAERVAGPYGALRLRVRVENHTRLPAAPRNRDEALAHALIAAHTLIGIPDGRFVSLTDPPEWAAAEAAACVNDGTWPVLAGPPDCRNLILSSPVILYDHPEVAPESAGDLFDATEIDEILTLRTLALTDAEKREARAGDPRAAELIDRLEDLPPQMLERLHGAIRYLGSPGGAAAAADLSGHGGVAAAGPAGGVAGGTGSAPFPDGGDGGQQVPWWDPGADRSVSPESDHVIVGGVRVARGSLVRMRPGARRADAQDLFLTGREALVEAVFQDVDGHQHVAVSPVSDPFADLQRSHGRFLYFAPDELEPVAADAPPTGLGSDGQSPGN